MRSAARRRRTRRPGAGSRSAFDTVVDDVEPVEDLALGQRLRVGEHVTLVVLDQRTSMGRTGWSVIDMVALFMGAAPAT